MKLEDWTDLIHELAPILIALIALLRSEHAVSKARRALLCDRCPYRENGEHAKVVPDKKEVEP